MSRHTYVNPEDEKVFVAIKANDAECNRCFECGAPNPQWCDVMHGTFICLNCSGQHRSLGVHLVFVRSSTMDGWINWKPEKLRQMQLGGNRRARLYFETNGVPKAPLKARYESLGALRYADVLEAEALGRTFNEATWQPPAWYTRLKTQASPSPSSPSPTAIYPTGSPNRFSGIGSNGQTFAGGNGNSSSSTNNSGLGDWFSALSSGWSAVTQKTAELAQHATDAVQQADVDGLKASLAQRWANVSSSVSTYAQNLQGQMEQREGGGVDGASGDDGFATMMQNARRAQAESEVGGAPADPDHYGHIEGGRACPPVRATAVPARGTSVQAGGAGAAGSAPVYQARVVSATRAIHANLAAPSGVSTNHTPVAPPTAASPNRPANPLGSNTGGVGATSSASPAKPKDDWAWDDF